jgi:hypothetical protein
VAELIYSLSEMSILDYQQPENKGSDMGDMHKIGVGDALYVTSSPDRRQFINCWLMKNEY